MRFTNTFFGDTCGGEGHIWRYFKDKKTKKMILKTNYSQLLKIHENTLGVVTSEGWWSFVIRKSECGELVKHREVVK